MNKQLNILVVGGSLAGLLSSIPLKRLGHKVTILERSPVPLLHDQGAGVVAGNETIAWVQKHGRSRRSADDIALLNKQRLYLDREGNIIDRETSHQRMTSWGVLYHIGRECFDGALQNPKPNNTTNGSTKSEDNNQGEASYEYGRTVTAIADKGNKVEVKYRQARKDQDATDTEGTLLGDFLIVADGPSTHLRKMLVGNTTAERTYAGYVAFRGTIPETDLSPAAQAVFVEKFTFFHGTNPNTQILAYTIPNAEGTLETGKRLINWVWYHNIEDSSPEYDELMTDVDGNKHRFTLPTGGHMQPRVWEKQKAFAKQTLPPQFAELVNLTDKPFVQAITDLEPPKSKREVARLMGGKAVIVGDALAGFRPHTAASTSQAALHALLLERVFSNDMTWDEYEDQVFEHAQKLQAHGVRLGTRSQFGHHPLAS